MPLSFPLPLSRDSPTFIFLGGASRTRTDHLLRARQALYQMSYGPLILGTLSIRSLTVTARYLYRNFSLPHLYGGSGWTRTTDLTLIRGAL